MKTNFKLDPWQIDFLEAPGNKMLCTGRQVGKSVICGMDAGLYALNNPGKTILMIAPTERQAYALFEKTLNYILDNEPKAICEGKDRPTKTRAKLKNGAIIWCLPVGISGIGIRFLTVHRLYADEASRIPEEVWHAVTPMLLTTGGDQIYLSTPAGKQGYYWKCWSDAQNSFKKFFISSEEVIRNREICSTWTVIQRDKALEYLQSEKRGMTKLQYAQEYEGLFVEEVLQFFPDELISSCMNKEIGPLSGLYDNFMGVDVARMGGDETVMLTLTRTPAKKLYMRDMKIFSRTTIPETVRRIHDENIKWDYRKIYIDDGGLGVGVSDLLLEDERTRRKTTPINNASRAWNYKKDKKRLMKEDLYTNLKVQMEQGNIILIKDDRLFNSLKSIQAEFDNGRLKIWGGYTHITEALIRAAYCVKDKSLNIWAY